MTARTALALLFTTLFTALLTLPLFAPATSFASAHTSRQAQANALTGISPTVAALRDERATIRDCGPSGNPTGPLHTRDRRCAADSAPEAPERPALEQDPAAARRAAPSGAAHSRTSRSSAGHTPAALQVFRC
ncbi:hypothetical protein [Streptomyces sp. NPDC046197]|uniref:hypothetical protein n=1 Tax=Streptomyces sp. NPDC046197 TaxID=3154337 RepID=UPI00340506E8